jgi:hypothetical protein
MRRSREPGKLGGLTRPIYCKPCSPAGVCGQALKSWAEHILQHRLVEGGIHHQLFQIEARAFREQNSWAGLRIYLEELFGGRPVTFGGTRASLA